MNFLDQIKIAKKFIILVSVTMALLLLIAVSSIYKSVNAVGSANDVTNKILPCIESIGEVQSLFKEFRICAIKLPTANADIRQNLLKKYEHEENAINSHISTLLLALKKEDVDSLDSVLKSYDSIVKGELMDLVNAGQVDKANTVISQKLVPLGEKYDEIALKLKNDLTERSTVAVTALKEDLDPILNNVIIVLVIVITTTFLTMVSKSIARRVSRLAKASAQIAKGDLTVQCEHMGKDEIGSLALNLNDLVKNLNSIVCGVKKDSDVLTDSSHELHGTSSNIISKSNDVLDKLITVSSASEEMAATSQEISSNCQLAASNSNETQQAAISGMNVVEQTVSDIRSHSEKTQQDALLILELGKKTEEINKIISTIEDIASQTNLLALNAAIEAARAGEHGKGFAVVADEVRALAVRTAEATKEISTMITTVTSDVQNANSSITDTVDKMKVIADNAGAVQESLELITRKIGDVNMQITQIASATEQQSGTAKEMSSNLQMIKNLTNEMSDLSRSTDVLTTNFNNLSADMEQTVSRFKL
ncbi:MAG: methyl-accepting chemotaxis protein [Succinivibrio sp.]